MSVPKILIRVLERAGIRFQLENDAIIFESCGRRVAVLRGPRRTWLVVVNGVEVYKARGTDALMGFLLREIPELAAVLRLSRDGDGVERIGVDVPAWLKEKIKEYMVRSGAPNLSVAVRRLLIHALKSLGYL